jgi:hypothetical protein
MSVRWLSKMVQFLTGGRPVSWKLPRRMHHELSSSVIPDHVLYSQILDESSKASMETRFSSERRLSIRFPLELPAEVSAGDVRITGKTANISSGGVLIACDSAIEMNTLVTVRMVWPVRQRKNPVVLVVQGEIVRREETGIALIRRRYEFEVGPAPAPVPSWLSSLVRKMISFHPTAILPQLDPASVLSLKA